MGSWPFLRCTALKSIGVDSENPSYSSDNGVLFNKDKTYLHRYSAGKTAKNYAIPK